METNLVKAYGTRRPRREGVFLSAEQHRHPANDCALADVLRVVVLIGYLVPGAPPLCFAEQPAARRNAIPKLNVRRGYWIS